MTPISSETLAVQVEQVVCDTLWCMHVSGADEVHPAPDRATAQLWAAQFTVVQQRHNPIPHPYDPVTNFTVQQWPWSAESHADGLARSIADNTWPVDPLATAIKDNSHDR